MINISIESFKLLLNEINQIKNKNSLIIIIIGENADQAGQLSNLHSLATTNRKPAIFFIMSFSGELKL